MDNSRNTVLVFGVLTFFQVVGGASLGVGVRGRSWLLVAWGLLVGAGPCYFGIEQGIKRGVWLPLAWQIAVLVACALAANLPQAARLSAFFLRSGMNGLMIGTFIMAAAAVAAAWLVRQGAEISSQIIGGIGFLFGAMWFGAGIQRLRGK